jgi:hypothetical protein
MLVYAPQPMKIRNIDTVTIRDKAIPTVVRPVQVQFNGFRCLAYRDKNGTWREFKSGKVLAGNLRKIERQDGAVAAR